MYTEPGEGIISEYGEREKRKRQARPTRRTGRVSERDREGHQPRRGKGLSCFYLHGVFWAESGTHV